MAELLLELFCEEIPARMQRDAAENLRKNIADKFAAAGLSTETLTAYVTPRRLILHAVGLPSRTPDIMEEKRGPKFDAPEQAIAGFLKSTGLSKDQLTSRADGKATFFYANIEQKGRPSADVVAEIIPAVVRSFAWPKSMRWGERSRTMDSLRWVRPLQSIICLLDGEVVPFDIDGLRSGNVTRGHRFISNSAFSVSSFDDYRTKLRLGRVIIDSEERAQIIEVAAKKLSIEAGLELVEDKALLVENAGLTEWPVPLLGSFDAAFLAVPPEVIQLTMRTNQKYFALRDASTGKLSHHFICTANIEASDGGKIIVAGNERVLAARLSDARFFWEQDQKKPLQDYLPKLADIVFHEKLGTVADKVERVAKLARELAPMCGADPDMCERAARLCKADLVTGMVGEFPELQGVMGSYYASAVTPAKAGAHGMGQTTGLESATSVGPGFRRDDSVFGGEHPDIARAIREHYAPQGPSDACPTAPVSVTVALADKLDSLGSFFAANEKPTGSKDPFALRRSAISISRILLENGIRLNLKKEISGNLKELKDSLKVMASQFMVYQGTQQNINEDIRRIQSRYAEDSASNVDWVPSPNLELPMSLNSTDAALEKFTPLGDTYGRLLQMSPEVLSEEVFSFLIDRLKVQQREQGVPHDLIDAVFALGGEDDLVRLLARVKALQAFLGSADGKPLLAGYKRAANILRIEEKKDAKAYAGDVNASLLKDAEEVALSSALKAAQSAAATAVMHEEFATAMTALAKLRAPIDAFFEKVIVNADDAAIRTNRLNLLAAIRAAIHTVADFSKIEG
jgi:glycyl-tRNA synthetase beta chain